MILVIDNYDSFVYNLVQYCGEWGGKIVVRRNDRITIKEVGQLAPALIIISPGPGIPEKAGISCAVIRQFSDRIPILGVCLGHQAIASAFGARIVQHQTVVHGKVSQIHHDGKSVYRNIDNPFVATRYHSLIIEKNTLPDCLVVSAWTDDGTVMGIRHTRFRVEGVQFHPESILTSAGKRILYNFIEGSKREDHKE